MEDICFSVQWILSLSDASSATVGSLQLFKTQLCACQLLTFLVLWLLLQKKKTMTPTWAQGPPDGWPRVLDLSPQFPWLSHSRVPGWSLPAMLQCGVPCLTPPDTDPRPSLPGHFGVLQLRPGVCPGCTEHWAPPRCSMALASTDQSH